ncbi:FxDxF family PEP-CTERM protein [Aquabacterium sp. A7-Y]|uniref:FxDxF family PEP-CTERM protein n=1 Tax=Aquabacterium sp. A7-Y TaxID=1349605 RepID=UPI00223D6D9A|nr:FxDxF family PEP-CTERM protein [Aquabacterium sp. A7-Y]MCW7540429.1 FxDxF family PEP-CTERM protein [Aquabacterium sp. A7-Y]
MKAMLYAAVSALALTAAGTSQAASYTYSFTQLVGGEQVQPLATLTVEDVAGGARFTLQGDFASLGNASFLSRIEFNGPQGSVGAVSGNAVKKAPVYGAHVNASYDFDWEIAFPTSNKPGSDRFLSTDQAVWTITGSGVTAASFDGTMMLHLQGVTELGDYSSIKVTAAVPEPETYALMLAGLAGVGLAARRRQRVR